MLQSVLESNLGYSRGVIVLCAFHLKITLTIDLLFPAIVIAFSAELLQGEYCINAIDT